MGQKAPPFDTDLPLERRWSQAGSIITGQIGRIFKKRKTYNKVSIHLMARCLLHTGKDFDWADDCDLEKWVTPERPLVGQRGNPH